MRQGSNAFRLARRALLAGLLICSPAIAQDTTVTLDQANQLARQAFVQGEAKAANELSYRVLAQRPDDARALVMVAATETQLGRPLDGREVGRRAFRLADDPVLKYEAAFFTASAAAAAERYNSAKFWLRRAYQAAPDETAKARVSRLFQGVARKSPLTVRLGFDVSPSSNINNGSRKEETGLFFGGTEVASTLSVDAQALSGLEYRATANFAYTLAENTRSRTTLNFGLDGSYYSLSSSSKRDIREENAAREAEGRDPRDISASDYNYETIYAGIQQQRISEDRRSSLTYGLTLGRSWYGGQPLRNFATGSVQTTRLLSETRSLSYGISLTKQNRLDNDRNSSTSATLNTSITQKIAQAGTLRYGGFVRHTRASSNEIDNDAIGLTLSYSFAQPVFAKTALSLSLGIQHADYERSVIFGERADTRLTADAVFTFRDIDYYGFSPTATISLARTNSSVARFETDSYGIKFGLRSSF